MLDNRVTRYSSRQFWKASISKDIHINIRPSSDFEGPGVSEGLTAHRASPTGVTGLASTGPLRCTNTVVESKSEGDVRTHDVNFDAVQASQST